MKYPRLRRGIFIDGENKYTYRNIEEQSKIGANFLLNIGGESERKIGVLTNSAYKTIVAMIGILFSRNVFCLLDFHTPTFRLKNQIDNLDYLIIDSHYNGNDQFAELELNNCNLLMYDDVFISQKKIRGKTFYSYHCDDPIYLYFTSGSTGEAKGIIGKNKSLAHFVLWEIKELNITENDTFSQITSPSFDPYLREVFVPICSGASICCLEDRRVLLSPSQLKLWVKKNNISVLHSTPAIFNLLCSKIKSQNEFPFLKKILLAGDFPRCSDLSKWYIFNPNTAIYNLYGPTETTMAKLFFKISSNDVLTEIIPVGKPLPNVNVYVASPELGGI